MKSTKTFFVCFSTITKTGTVKEILGSVRCQKTLHAVYLLLMPDSLSLLSHFMFLLTATFSGLSKFHQEPSPQTVHTGGAARFECQIEGVPTPVITWEKDKVAVPEETRWAFYCMCYGCPFNISMNVTILFFVLFFLEFPWFQSKHSECIFFFTVLFFAWCLTYIMYSCMCSLIDNLTLSISWWNWFVNDMT